MKKPLSSKSVNFFSILLDGAFAFTCFFSFVCACILVSISIITRDQTGVTGFQLTPNNSDFPDAVINFIGLFSDRVFEARRTTFISDPYLEIGAAHSLLTGAFAAAAIFSFSRPVHRLAFGQQFFTKKNSRCFTTAAAFLLLMAVVPLIIKSVLIANGDNLLGLYSIHGLVLAVILYFASFLIDCGTDLLPSDEISVEDEDEKAASSSKTTAISKLGQNSRALLSIMWLALIAVIGAALWEIISMIPILPYITADNALIVQDAGENTILSIMLGTVEELQYTPVALMVRYAWELAVLIIAALAVIKGIKILGRAKTVEDAFTAQTTKLFYSCSILTLICSIVGLGGSVASYFLTGVRFTVPVCGFLCAAALLMCGRLTAKLAQLKEESDKRKLEAEDDISDLSFVLH